MSSRPAFDPVDTSFDPVLHSQKDDVESPSLSSGNALARFEFEPGRSRDGTKVLMVEWEEDASTRGLEGDWEISWEGKRTVLPATDPTKKPGDEVPLNRIYFMLGPGVVIPTSVKLRKGSVQWRTNPLPAIFSPELGATARQAGKKGVLHTIWAKKRLQVLQREIDAETKKNSEGIGLEMAEAEKGWIEDNFGVLSKPSSVSLPGQGSLASAMGAAQSNNPASPRSPGGGRLMDKLKGLKLGTSSQQLNGRSSVPADSQHPLSPEMSDVALGSFGSFAALKGTPPPSVLAAKAAQTSQAQKRVVAQRPPDSFASRQRQEGGMGSLNAFADNDTGFQRMQPSDADKADDLFALPMSPRSPEMTKSPFSFGTVDTMNGPTFLAKSAHDSLSHFVSQSHSFRRPRTSRFGSQGPEATANTSRDNETATTSITAISKYPILWAHERPVPAPLRKQCNDEKDHEAGLEATDTQRNEFISTTSSHGDESDCSTTIKQRETVAKTGQNRKAKGSDEATCSIPEVRWESTFCVHMDRNYWPRPYYGETNLHLVKEMLVTDSEGDNFHFAHCGHLYLCDCYSIFDAIEEPLIVASDAGVRRKNEPNSVTGIGVFVGPGSPFNASEVAVPCPDSMAAELSAALRALQTVKQMKERGRIPLVSEVILKTDNESMEGAMTGTIFKWRRDGFLDDSGRAIKYRDLYWVLEEAVVELYNSHHTAVLFFWTPRRYNIDADRLATAALRQEDIRLGIFVAKPVKSQQRKRKCDEDEQANLMNVKRLCAQIPPASRRDSATTLVPSSDAHRGQSPPGLPDHLSGVATQHPPKFIGPLRPSLAELGKSASPGDLSSIATQNTPKLIGPYRSRLYLRYLSYRWTPVL
ncbi:hypothetical protein LTR32_001302 [Rachicladosporium monterosium]|uniref:RNase H type-1 domain-containing protein n=1 Tax=Rachicladosporium monterosium TaxID=1507873 RepID=A0ABR0LDM3_9PEZI|nr:hypothetical protein LTR32_001302 [Rachicladosporium monterosium]